MAEQLRILGDETRLRILRLLREDSLNVGELMSILGLAQPTVSKHLAELRRTGLVDVERTSGYSFYRLLEPQEGWCSRLLASLGGGEDGREDLIRLKEVLKQRAEHLEVQDRFVVPGRSWLAWSRGLRFLLPSLRVADLGCGDGTVTAEIAAWAAQVIAIDCNEALLRQAREKTCAFSNVEFRLEDMEKLSLEEGSVELALFSQSLHYLDSPEKAIDHAFRILTPGGRVLILDLLTHNETWVLSQLHHRRQGYTASTMRRILKTAGFGKIQLDTGTKQGPEPFRVLVATGIKPGETAP
jgi:DNA-binding transcriptional ArsR family regulator/precorrin-6B methylase 2